MFKGCAGGVPVGVPQALELAAAQEDRRLAVWVRSRLGGERDADLARELGYADAGGVLRVVQRLEAAAQADRRLRRTLERLRETVHLSNVKRTPTPTQELTPAPTRKVNLVSLRDGIDLNTPAGRLMANVLASVSQYETEVRAERVRAGQAVARAKGKRWGGSQKGRRLKVTEEQVALIRRMAAEGEKIAAIARATGLTRPTVYNYLPAA